MGEELVLVVKRPERQRRILIASITGLAVAILIAAGAMYWLIRSNEQIAFTIPRSYTQKVTFPLYVPRELPAGYALDPQSFQIKDEVLFFWIKNGSKKIIFAEETKPLGFDFQAFYRQQMGHPKSIPGAPYPSVMGTIENGVLLSITDEQTWLLITGQGASQSDMQSLARNMKRL